MSLNEIEQLLIRYNAGQCSPEEEALVEKWLDRPSSNNSSWHELDAIGKEKFVHRLFTDIQATIIENEHPVLKSANRLGSRWWIGMGVAASICLFVFAYIFMGSTSQPKYQAVEWLEVTAAPGHKKELHLRDGTVIWLQGGSKLYYPKEFTDSVRMVKLEGEAYFEVFHNETQPFIVDAGDLNTRVLGTSFNIEAYPKLSKQIVSLIEGKVSVQLTDSNGGSIGYPLILQSTESLVYEASTQLIVKERSSLQSTSVNFKEGNLQFEETPLTEVLIRLGNAYGLQIYYDTNKAKGHKLTGSFTVSQPVDEVLKSVATSIGMTFSRKERKVEFKL